MKKILGSFRNNIGLKLISVLVAIVIWYVVVDIDDPVQTGTYLVKVTVENEAYITGGKQIYHIDDEYKTVGVSVRANRSTLKDIDEDDISVIADLTQIVDMDRDPVMVPLTASCKGITQANITLDRATIPVIIEDTKVMTFAVTPDTGDTIPSEEYEVGRMTANPDQIVIRGPESIINQIDSVVARINVTGMTIDSTRNATLVLMNKDQSPISEETIQDDLTFVGGDPDVTVSVELWKRNSDVTLDVAYAGTPAEGYHVEGISTTPETFTVVGNAEALEALAQDGNVIHVPDTQISVEGATSDVAAEIELAEVLPDNLRLARSTAEEATINITILSDQTKDLLLDVDDIVVQNLDPNLSVFYEQQTELPIRVRGAGAMIENVTAEDVTAMIDLANLAAGDVTVPVTFTLPTGITLDGAVTIDVSLKEKVKQEGSGEEGAAEE